MNNELRRATSEEIADAKLFDDLLEEENRAIVAAGGPRKLTDEELAEASKAIEAYKQQHRAEINKYMEQFKNIEGLEIENYHQ